MLPLGFSQGPGVALSMGDAWEATAGMPDGGQIGLMISGLGFGVCCLAGVTLYHVARHKGWLSTQEGPSLDSPAEADDKEPTQPGDIDPLSFHIVLIGAVYLLTFSVLLGLTELIGDKPKIIAQLWGFHFLFALGLAVLVRSVLNRSTLARGVQDSMLNRIAGLVVDFTAVAAISAVRHDLLAHYWVILSLMAIIGATCTAVFCLWLARRSFFDQPFEQILVMFGALTGTLPTGLTLLRLADPEMKSSASRDYVLGSGASVLPAVVLLAMLPVIVSQPENQLLWMGVMVVYGLILVGLWMKLGGLKFVRPLSKFWPEPTSEER